MHTAERRKGEIPRNFWTWEQKKVWLRAFERLKEKRRGLFVQSFESVSGFFARFSGKRVGVWEGVYGTPDGAHGVGTREEVKESPGGS